MAKFQPMAGHTYTVLFEYNEPRHGEATDKFSENWSYGVKVDGNTDMLYWNVYSARVMETIKSMGILKGIPIQVVVAQEMGEKGKPYNTYQFIKDNVSYYSQQTQPAETQQPIGEPPQQPEPPDPTEELDKRMRLMGWCIDTVMLLTADRNFEQSDIVPLIQSLHVEIRDKGVYPPKDIEDEIKDGIETAEEKFEEGNQHVPRDIHGEPAGDLPF